MNILVTNDDGILSEGILALANVLKTKHNVTIIAPDGNRSGYSRSMSFHKDLTFLPYDLVEGVKAYTLSGTPCDCVRFGISGLDLDIDLVIAGINHGSNLGNDIFYSGTVNACFEGNLFGIPAIAISNVAHKDYKFNETAKIIEKYIDNILKCTSKDYTLNINIPNVEFEKIKGVKVCKPGVCRYTDGYIKTSDTTYRLIGEPIPPTEDEYKTDVYYVYDNYVSITPVVHTLVNQVICDKLKDVKF
jgi:5'-nucleotidase